MSEEQLQKAVEGFGKFAPLTLITVPIFLIIVFLIMAGIVHLVVNIMSSRSNYKKTLSLISFCGIITIIEQIISTAVLRMRGVESVESAADMKFSLSLAPLLGDGKGLLNAVLQSLSIFQHMVLRRARSRHRRDFQDLAEGRRSFPSFRSGSSAYSCSGSEASSAGAWAERFQRRLF